MSDFMIPHWVSRQAEQAPDRVALVWKGERLSYAELEARANRLARLLIDGGCRPGDRVAFVVPKSPAAYLCMLGTLKAGCAYVPIDTDCPASRVLKIVESCEPRWLLATRRGTKMLDEMLRETTLTVRPRIGSVDDAAFTGDHFQTEFCLADLASVESTLPTVQVASDAPAHILFTSGSTGTPKGVVITHANVQAFVEWGVDYFQLGPHDKVSGHAPLHFDLSTYDTYGAFAAGAELNPVPAELNLLPHELAEFIRNRELTQWFSVPSILSYLARFDAVQTGDFPFLKRLMWCGEVFPTPSLIHWMQRLPHVQFTNLYGPTEATIASSYHTVATCPESETEQIPIGLPCTGEELLVLDERLQPLPPGEIGNLYIGGVGLSPGYWRDAEKTAAVFMPHPFDSNSKARIYQTGDLARLGEDGLVYFLGRADTQIKSRGYRIELGEIETALGTLDLLAESAVVAVDTDGFENKAICCAYVPAAGLEVKPAVIRSALSKLIPRYMLPERWQSFSVLPKNANGKIDRPQLREQFAAAVQSAPPGRAAQPSPANQ